MKYLDFALKIIAFVYVILIIFPMITLGMALAITSLILGYFSDCLLDTAAWGVGSKNFKDLVEKSKAARASKNEKSS